MTIPDNRAKLVVALRACKLDDLAERAARGEFSDFHSPHATPVMRLVRELEAAGQPGLAARAKHGDFDHE